MSLQVQNDVVLSCYVTSGTMMLYCHVMSLQVQSDVVIVRLCHLRYKMMLHCHFMSLQVQNDVVLSCYVTSGTK